MTIKSNVMTTRGGKPVQTKVRSIDRTMTAATAVATLPRGSRILYFMLSGTASNPGGTGPSATYSIGSTQANANEFVNGQDVTSAGAGNGVNLLKGVTAGVGGTADPESNLDIRIWVKYAETGTVASTTGSWFLYIFYTTGNNLDNDTLASG